MRRIILLAVLVVIVGFAVVISTRSGQFPARFGRATPAPSVAPTPDDVAIARNALTVEDILGMLDRGDSQETIIRAVRERRITQKIVEAQELQLSVMGARRQLLKELKDSNNVLTPSQELAYGRLPRRSSPRPAATGR
ncbi:MAG TPA: hypothetical protein VJ719_02140 [Chthoniobacterales bacterium]|nr:hypothetical protein [Chthoniobacterales bacterium]